jgi:predicted RNA-binding Zn-ribbon protein involved in translation (DUF1610 family)
MARHSDQPPSRSPSHKSVLFCPACGHEEHIDGDWSVYPTLDGDVYRCPTCHEAVTVRPTERDNTPAVSLVDRSVRAAFAWVPCTELDHDPDVGGRSRGPLL